MIHIAKIQTTLLSLFILLISACSSDVQKEFQESIAVKADIIQIDNSKDTLIFGSQGTGLYFEKNSFVLSDGSYPKGEISIQLKECYSNSDMIREGLSTTSNGKLLETRGMINVLAYSNDQELKLKDGKKFIIHFPKDSSDSKQQMNLFYGNDNGTTGLDWELDSNTLLKPTAFMNGWSTRGYAGGDTSRRGFYFKGQTSDSIYDYFYKNFDNSKLKATKEDLLDKLYEAEFTVTTEGKITNVNISEMNYDNAGNRILSGENADPYFYEYIQQIPQLEPFYGYIGNGILKPIDSRCSFYFSIGLYPPDYLENENYNNLFNRKYSSFKNNTITSINEAELNYYIFSSTKLGWINCDFFWETNDEKIDYMVKVDPRSNPNIKLVFKESKTILAGTLEGDTYVFRNVPVNRDIKIVAISFKGSQPLLGISLTKTDKQPFEKLEYRNFTLTDLEEEINAP